MKYQPTNPMRPYATGANMRRYTPYSGAGLPISQ